MRKRKPSDYVRFRRGGFLIQASTRYKGYCEDGCILGWGHLSQCVTDKDSKQKGRSR